MMMMKIRSRLL